MRTDLMLMAQYEGRPMIPVDEVCRDYFSHLKPEQFIRQVERGDILLPLIRTTDSQKAAKLVKVQDLADYLDARYAAAKKEMLQIAS